MRSRSSVGVPTAAVQTTSCWSGSDHLGRLTDSGQRRTVGVPVRRRLRRTGRIQPPLPPLVSRVRACRERDLRGSAHRSPGRRGLGAKAGGRRRAVQHGPTDRTRSVPPPPVRRREGSRHRPAPRRSHRPRPHARVLSPVRNGPRPRRRTRRPARSGGAAGFRGRGLPLDVDGRRRDALGDGDRRGGPGASSRLCAPPPRTPSESAGYPSAVPVRRRRRDA